MRTNGFKEVKQINSIIFDENMTVEFCNKNCFQDFKNLTKIDFMKSKLSNIGKFIFGNVGITDLHITIMGILYRNSFNGCKKLTKVNIYSAAIIPNNAFKDCLAFSYLSYCRE